MRVGAGGWRERWTEGVWLSMGYIWVCNIQVLMTHPVFIYEVFIGRAYILHKHNKLHTAHTHNYLIDEQEGYFLT